MALWSSLDLAIAERAQDQQQELELELAEPEVVRLAVQQPWPSLGLEEVEVAEMVVRFLICNAVVLCSEAVFGCTKMMVMANYYFCF